MKAIEASSLTFSYDEEMEALHGLSFSLDKGEYLAVIGHNGSGKSTLAKILVGLLMDFDGEIKIFDLPLNKKNIGKIRSKVAIVFQNQDNQFVGSTVADDIAFGLENKNVPHDKMQSIIDEYALKVGMDKYLDKAPENLSGGQKQRVAIAGVLAMHPDLFFLDEATSMLDPVGKREILELVGKMRKENPDLTVVSITHDVEEAALADKVMVLDKGNMVLFGSPKEVFANKEILKSVNLEQPYFMRLIEALKENGIYAPDNINNISELEDFLCR